MRTEKEAMSKEEVDESLANLEAAGLITWDRGAGLIYLTELGKDVGGLLPKEWALNDKGGE